MPCLKIRKLKYHCHVLSIKNQISYRTIFYLILGYFIKCIIHFFSPILTHSDNDQLGNNCLFFFYIRTWWKLEETTIFHFFNLKFSFCCPCFEGVKILNYQTMNILSTSYAISDHTLQWVHLLHTGQWILLFYEFVKTF